MTANTFPELIERFAQDALAKMRLAFAEKRIKQTRLPAWTKAAHMRSCVVGKTAIIIFEDNSEERDTFNFDGIFPADINWLFSMPHLRSSGTHMYKFCKPGQDGYLSLCCNSHPSAVVVTSTEGSFLDSRPQISNHFTIAWCNIAFALSPEDHKEQRIAHRYVPLMLWVATCNLERKIDDKHITQLTGIHKQLADGNLGDRIEQRAHRIEVFKIAKQRGVIVLGAYADIHMAELLGVRDSLRNLAYDAEVIARLPDIDVESNLEKVQRWTLASRFAIMVDRDASGHVAEYQVLRQQKTILALLRPTGHGSTWMIGDDQDDLKYIRTFEFERSPLDVLSKAVDWAEKAARKREDYLNRLYPWRTAKKPNKRKSRRP